MLQKIREELLTLAIPAQERKAVFFKTGPGEYAEHDQFLGVPTPELRRLAKVYHMLPLEETIDLLQSPVNEERMLALFIFVNRHQRGDGKVKENIYLLYQRNISYVNNWNLVDASAHWIVGSHLYRQSKDYLFHLVQSQSLWKRRIAIISTWYSIRQNNFSLTIELAVLLMHDTHDLIHKVVGWMLREIGKRDEGCLLAFLDNYAHKMPRTMLRYAIEKLDKKRKQMYLARGVCLEEIKIEFHGGILCNF